MLGRSGKEVLVVIVPMHPQLAKGTLRSVLRQADLSVKDLIRLS